MRNEKECAIYRYVERERGKIYDRDTRKNREIQERIERLSKRGRDND